MAREAFYFTHDYGSRNDPKLQKVLMKLGHEGKSVYWDLVEMLYEEGGYLLLEECENYAFALRTHYDCIAKLLNDFDLFQKDDEKFWSESILRRLNQRFEKSKKASDSARMRWNNTNASRNNANASKNDAIKERKGKEIKKNSISTIADVPTEQTALSKPTPVKSDKSFAVCMDVYNQFIISRTGASALIDGATGKALKDIIAYLKTQVKDKDNLDNGVINGFTYIFANYDSWGAFHQGQLKLNQIKGNLINILNNIRNGKPTTNNRKPTTATSKYAS